MTTAAQTGSVQQTPENMAETLKLAYDAQQAAMAIKEVVPGRDREVVKEAEAVKYTISPKKGALTAQLWVPDGERNWILSSDETAVTAGSPFVAGQWIFNPHGSHGMEFTFFSNDMDRDDSGNPTSPVWQLTVNAEDLDNLKIVEERAGEVVSEWLGRHAIFGAAPVSAA